MNSRREQPIWLLQLLAISLVAGGLVFSYRTWTRIEAGEILLGTRHNEIEALKGMELELLPYRAAAQATTARAAERVTPSGLLRETIPSLAPEDVNSSEVDLGEGWVLKRESLMLPEGDLKLLMAGLPQLESPPWFWRLTRVDVRAAATPVGHGQVSLEFETVVPPR